LILLSFSPAQVNISHYLFGNILGLADSDLAVILSVRHESTAFAFDDAMWAKYGFGTAFKLNDAKGKPETANVSPIPLPQPRPARAADSLAILISRCPVISRT